jgi:hypothetical protein
MKPYSIRKPSKGCSCSYCSPNRKMVTNTPTRFTSKQKIQSEVADILRSGEREEVDDHNYWEEEDDV